MQSAYNDAVEHELVREIPSTGHGTHFKAMGELSQSSRDTVNNTRQYKRVNTDVVRSLGYKLQLFLDLSMVALESWEHNVKEIMNLGITRQPQHPQQVQRPVLGVRPPEMPEMRHETYCMEMSITNIMADLQGQLCDMERGVELMRLDDLNKVGESDAAMMAPMQTYSFHHEMVGGVTGSYTELWMIYKPAPISGIVGILRAGYLYFRVCAAAINMAMIILAVVARGTVQVHAIEVIAVAEKKSQQQNLRAAGITVSLDDFPSAQQVDDFPSAQQVYSLLHSQVIKLFNLILEKLHDES